MEAYKSIFKESKKSLHEASGAYFEAHIFFDTAEDSYEEGELIDSPGTDWDIVLKDKTLAGLLKKVATEVNAPNVKDLEYQGEVNDYDDATELWWGFLADENNSEATDREVEEWKKGNKRLWSVHCHILISQIGKTKVSEDDLKSSGIKFY